MGSFPVIWILVALGLVYITIIVRTQVLFNWYAVSAPKRRRGTPTHLMIVLGSGGHTAEMLAMLDKAVFGSSGLFHGKEGESVDDKLLQWSDYTCRTWVTSSGDSFSALRAAEFEAKVQQACLNKSEQASAMRSYTIVSVPRARKVHQPLWSTPFSCLRCAFACIPILLGETPSHTAQATSPGVPDLVLTNGPATATVLIFTSLLLRFLNLRSCWTRLKMRTIYVESWARVKGMSLSGKLLRHVADRTLVQWEDLAKDNPWVEYHGVLCF